MSLDLHKVIFFTFDCRNVSIRNSTKREIAFKLSLKTVNDAIDIKINFRNVFQKSSDQEGLLFRNQVCRTITLLDDVPWFVKRPYIYDVHTEGGWSLEICQVLVDSIVLNNTSIVHFCRWWGWEGARVRKLVIFSGRHQWVTLNLKLSFELMLITITKNLLLNNLKIKNYCAINSHSETWRIETEAHLGPSKTSIKQRRI